MESQTEDDVYLLADTSAALTSRKFAKDLESVLTRAKEAGVQKIVIRAHSLTGSADALRLCRLFACVGPDLYCCAGVSANESRDWSPESEQQITDLLQKSTECVALGECGLDFGRELIPRAQQLEVFEKQLGIARRLQKPLIIQSRDAHEDVARLLREMSSDLPKTVIQCFGGSKEEAERYLSLSDQIFISLSGYLCREKTENGIKTLLEAKSLPLNRLLLASDCPFGYPNTRANRLKEETKHALSVRSTAFLTRYCTFQRNEPCSLPTLAELIAHLSAESASQIALQSTYNALKVFGF